MTAVLRTFGYTTIDVPTLDPGQVAAGVAAAHDVIPAGARVAAVETADAPTGFGARLVLRWHL